MNLDSHYRFGRFIFWFAQIVGIFTIVSLILFLGGNMISEIIDKSLDYKEDYLIFIVFLFEVLVGISFIISWKRKRLGPVLILFFTGLISILWGKDSPEILWFFLPLVISGLLLLFYSYYKEWILKRKL